MNEVLLAILLGLAAYEIKAWFPRLIQALIALSVTGLPKRQRGRFHEEWSAHIADVPGGVAKLWHAVGFVWASRRMAPRWQRSVQFLRARARGEAASLFTIRVIDIAMMLPTIIFFAPLLAIASAAAALGHGGSVLDKKPRIGAGGRVFEEFRFRADPETQIGRFFIRYAFDGLPRFFNILRGDMSLIGFDRQDTRYANAKPSLVPALNISPITKSGKTKPVWLWVLSTIGLFGFTYYCLVFRLMTGRLPELGADRNNPT